MFQKNVLLLSSEWKSEDTVHKNGEGTGIRAVRKPVADYDYSIQLITDADFCTFAITSYCLMPNYVEMILSLNVVNILHHKPKVVECCALFTRELKVSYHIMPL